MLLQRADRLADRRLADAIYLRCPREAFSFCQVAEDLEAFKLHNWIKQKSCFTVKRYARLIRLTADHLTKQPDF